MLGLDVCYKLFHVRLDFTPDFFYILADRIVQAFKIGCVFLENLDVVSIALDGVIFELLDHDPVFDHLVSNHFNGFYY